jgi:glycosyltransferase involved in cell wall biosynthesis
MKILLAHNFYGSSAPSGENTVYEAEKKLLEEHGHKVSTFTRHSDEIRGQGIWGAIKGGISTPWNNFSYYGLKKRIATEKPDILHVHNFFPLLSPAIFHAARGQQTATVLTLHNYRLFCAAGIPMRDAKICTDCLDRHSVLPALQHGCYRNSRLANLPMAVMISLHRLLGTWHKHVDAFITLTQFQKELMVAAGLPKDRVHVKPQFYANPPSPLPWESRSRRVVYMGRLGEEKGVRVLLDAWQQWGRQCPELDIIGDGPLRQELQAISEQAGLGDRVNFLGQLPFTEAQERLAQAGLMVVPSLWFEGFPMVIREAFALGVPVAASNIGSLPCIVNEGKNGVLIEPGNAKAFYHAVKTIWDDQNLLDQMGRNARTEFEERYTADANHDLLMEIYEKAISNRRRQHTGLF